MKSQIKPTKLYKYINKNKRSMSIKNEEDINIQIMTLCHPSKKDKQKTEEALQIYLKDWQIFAQKLHKKNIYLIAINGNVL